MIEHLMPFVVGLLIGAVIAGALRWTDVGRERGAWTVLLCAIAVFYPVFAVEHGGIRDLALHGSIALAFIGLAVVGFRFAANVIAFGLIAHGMFDLIVATALLPPSFSSTAPSWWPAFCAGIDIVVGVALLLFPQELHARTDRVIPD